ncbi:MAG TPA: hypothetical protein VHV74_09800 [Pseudonocardiaceae bacterium]|nr:hypothetical protein [Pseudonocardiaceae bacterium]
MADPDRSMTLTGRHANVRLLTEVDEIAAEAAVLVLSPKRRLRVAEPGQFRIPADLALRSGVTCQVLSGSGVAGEHVRRHDRLPVALLLVDDVTALVGTGLSALLVREAPLLAVLSAWFDLLWAGTSTGPMPDELPLRVLRMMPTDDDTAIARKLGLSVSTVRRHIKALYLMLGVDNRFAAGVAATRRGWL